MQHTAVEACLRRDEDMVGRDKRVTVTGVTAAFWPRLASVRIRRKRRSAAAGPTTSTCRTHQPNPKLDSDLQPHISTMLTRITSVSARRLPRLSAVSTRLYSDNQFK